MSILFRKIAHKYTVINCLRFVQIIQRNDIMKSEAKKRADKKYHDKTYKTISIAAKFDQYDKITDYCNSHGISKNSFLLSAAAYVIDHNIKL